MLAVCQKYFGINSKQTKEGTPWKAQDKINYRLP